MGREKTFLSTRVLSPRWWWNALAEVWRLLLAVIVCEEVGGIVGLLVGFHHSSFMNHWLGAAIAAPVGLMIGLLWQFARPERRTLSASLMAAFTGVLTMFLCTGAILGTIPRMRTEMLRLQDLTALDATTIERISVLDRYGPEKVCDIDDPAVITQFAEACRDVKGNVPNHPVYTSSWYVVLRGSEPREIECHYERGRPDELVGYYAHKVGNLTHYYGSFSSKRLREWFKSHVQKPNP